MNRKYLGWAVLMSLMIFVISGCETVPKKFKEEVSGIKARVETLESRVEGVEAKQSDVEGAQGEQAKALERLKRERERRIKTNISTKTKFLKVSERTKKIQLCLKNAGFYKGELDGIKGKNTRRSIREFQEANGLAVDGVVGKKTWELLSRYAQGGKGEGPEAEGAVK